MKNVDRAIHAHGGRCFDNLRKKSGVNLVAKVTGRI